MSGFSRNDRETAAISAPRRINTEENVDLGTKNYYTQIVEIVRTNGWNCYEVIGYVDFIPDDKSDYS